eukprot:6474793-Alexandrium_andersonii.AAC.1
MKFSLDAIKSPVKCDHTLSASTLKEPANRGGCIILPNRQASQYGFFGRWHMRWWRLCASSCKLRRLRTGKRASASSGVSTPPGTGP